MDFSKEIASLQEARKSRLEARKQIDKDVQQIEAALDALGGTYIAPKVRPDKIGNNRKVLEILQEKPRTINDAFYVMQKEGWEGVKTNSGFRQIVDRLVAEGKVQKVHDTYPTVYKVTRDLKVVAGEGVVS